MCLNGATPLAVKNTKLDLCSQGAIGGLEKPNQPTDADDRIRLNYQMQILRRVFEIFIMQLGA